MFENLITTGKTAQTENLAVIENLTHQVMKILSGKGSNPATLKFISQLQTGKIFDAVFTGNIPGGKEVLSLEGKKVIIELPRALKFEGNNEQEKATNGYARESTRASLTKDQAIRVRIESPGPRPTLKIISPPLHKDLPKSEEIKTNLTSRGKAISRQFGVQEFSQAPEAPNRLINATVTRILDSKSILVNTGSKNVVVPVENVESLKPGSQISPLSSGNKTIQLYVRKDSSDEEAENKNKKNSHNVAFFLDLSFLGKIKINAQIGPERLSVKIDAESEEIANFINKKANGFKEKMSEHDIETSVACCAIYKAKPAKDSLIELLVSQNTSLVNIKT